MIHENLAQYAVAPGIFPVPGTNICNHFKLRKGDPERGFKESDLVLEDTYRSHMVQHAHLETHASIAPRVCRNAGFSAAGPYQVPNVRIDSYCVYTNHPIGGAFRGFGIPQMSWAIEFHLAVMAKRLGLDPLEVRLKNAVEEGSLSVTGQVLHSVGLKETLRQAAEKIGWGKAAGPCRGKGIHGALYQDGIFDP